MKKLNWKFIAMMAMFAFALPMGCGDYEHQKKDKQAGELCANDGDCFGDLVCGNERELKGVCTTWDVARCNDGVQNYGESDVDCGWSCRVLDPDPNLCEAGQKCNTNFDCNGQTHTLVCNDGVCGEPRNTQCSSANPCPVGQNCLSGACVLNTVCTPACTSGFVCVNNSCQTASFQDKLCATPTVACNVTCWSQYTAGVMDINAQFVAANQQLCCPSTSGSFTLPSGTPGSYTGWHGETTARPFEPFSNVFGGYK